MRDTGRASAIEAVSNDGDKIAHYKRTCHKFLFDLYGFCDDLLDSVRMKSPL
jgi:hypothetical protein